MSKDTLREAFEDEMRTAREEFLDHDLMEKMGSLNAFRSVMLSGWGSTYYPVKFNGGTEPGQHWEHTVGTIVQDFPDLESKKAKEAMRQIIEVYSLINR